MNAPHMTPQEFREYGHRTVDWIADYWERLESLPVAPRVDPGETRARLPATAPRRGEGFDPLLKDLDTVVLPGLLHWQHPRFFGYFPANTSGPAVLADLISSGLGVQGMSWATGPACTELEERVLDWMVDLLGLPAHFRSDGRGGGVIQDTASSALLCALVAALHRASKGTVRQSGLSAHRYAVYVSSETHSSALKAAIVAGLGEDAVRVLDPDPRTLALGPERLRAAVLRDLDAGVTPLLAIATVGTTSTAANDPVAAIGEICREHGIWLHVDAAYAGVAAVCPELRGMHTGVAEYADSYCTNPHKWLLTTFDCDTFWVADRQWLTSALTVLPEYLRNAATESGAVTDYRDWQIPLGRRFRSLKLWAVLRWYGQDGLRRHIRHSIALAQEFASWVRADERFELTAPHPLSLVCFRLRPRPDADPDTDNLRFLDQVNAAGGTFLTHSRIHGRVTLRLAVGGVHTEQRHLEEAWHYLSTQAAATA